MKYAKPEVVVLASALDAIQAGEGIKNPRLVADFDPHSTVMSNGAYEADE
jgi:hypothetical protein